MSAIADLILEIGRARAQGAAQQGHVWGSALANIGQIPGQVMQQRRQEQRDVMAQQELNARLRLQGQESELNQQRLAAGEQTLASGRQAVAQQSAVDAVYAATIGDDGLPDMAKVQQVLAASGQTHLLPIIREQRNKWAASDEALTASKTTAREAAMKLEAEQRDALGADGAALAAAQYDPGLFGIRVSMLAKQGRVPTEQADTWIHQAEQDPASVRSIVDQWIGGSKTQQALAHSRAEERRANRVEVPQGGTLVDTTDIDPTTGQPRVVARGLVDVGKPAVVTADDLTRYRAQIDAIVPVSDAANAQLRAATVARVTNARTTVDAQKAIEDAQNQIGQINVAKNTVPFKIEAGQAQSGAARTDADSIAAAIIAGDQPPTVQGLYRMAGPVRAELAKQGYNLTSANLDWEATKKHLATLNGAQQTRLRQAIGTASDSLSVIEDLANQWDGGRFPLLNKANLALARNGVLGKEAQQIATNLTAQITDVTSELGNVYMGGNSPTDHALQLAGKNLSADWNREQLLSAVKLARMNLQIRNNSIVNAGPVLSTGGAPTTISTPATANTPPAGRIRVKGPHGEHGTFPATATLPTGWTKE